jgi:hypothetical protein
VPLETPGPDPLEKGIRIGCGGLFGLVAGGLVLYARLRRLRVPPETYLLTAVPTVLCAWAALRYGDRFWEGMAGRRASWRKRRP